MKLNTRQKLVLTSVVVAMVLVTIAILTTLVVGRSVAIDRLLLKAIYRRLPSVFLILAAILSFAIGFARLLTKSRAEKAITVTVGNNSMTLSSGLFGVLLGIALIVYMDWSWNGRNSMSAIPGVLPGDLSEVGNDVEEIRPKYVTDAQWTLHKGVTAYGSGDYDKALCTLQTIETKEEYISGTALFYENMCRFRVLLYRRQNFLTLDSTALHDLQDGWERFEATFPKHRLFADALYWKGQSFLTFTTEAPRALALFERVVQDYSYSRWVEGALYYSALLLHRREDPDSKQKAVDRMNELRIEHPDKLIRVVEDWQDIPACERAGEALHVWQTEEALAQGKGQKPSVLNPIGGRLPEPSTSTSH